MWSTNKSRLLRDNRAEGECRPHRSGREHGPRVAHLGQPSRAIRGKRGQTGLNRWSSWIAERSPSPNPQTGNAQQRRHFKALMRHTATRCFPSTRFRREQGAPAQLRKTLGRTDGGVEIWVAGRPPSPKPQTANAQQRRRHKALMRHMAASCFLLMMVKLARSRSPQLRKTRGRRDGVDETLARPGRCR